MPSVMISYNHKSSADLAFKLDEKLQLCGYKTWIDKTGMDGNIYQSMAEAIETSDAVLVLLTNEYCKSEACKLECSYAFNKAKYIIPIKCTKDYTPSGSVGLLTSSLQYIDFTKNDFDTQFQLLLEKTVRYDNSHGLNDDCLAPSSMIFPTIMKQQQQQNP